MWILYEPQTGHIKVSSTREIKRQYPGLLLREISHAGRIDHDLLRYDSDNDQLVARSDQEIIQQQQNRDRYRRRRNALLTMSDWTELPSNQARKSPAWQQAWAEYRQALRDIDFDQPQWPTAPTISQ